MTIPEQLVVAGGLAVGFFYFARRHALLTLRWPSEMDYYDLTRRTGRYLRYRRWKLWRYDGAGYDFIASRGGPDFALTCRPSNLELSLLAIKDFAELRHIGVIKHKIMVFVSANEASWELVNQAFELGIFLLHYRSLNEFASMDPANEQTLRALVLNAAREKHVRMIGSTPQETESTPKETQANDSDPVASEFGSSDSVSRHLAGPTESTGLYAVDQTVFRAEQMAFLSICAVVKNEADYIFEWLSYHYSLGVDRFVIFHNSSTDRTLEVIDSWPNRDLVEVIEWPFEAPQISAYEEMLHRHRGVSEWCAFIDVDEFLCPKGSLSLIDVLRSLPAECGGLYVHWLFFGSSGKVDRLPGPVTTAFTKRSRSDFGPNQIGKSIVRLGTATKVINPHIIGNLRPIVNDLMRAIDQEGGAAQPQASHMQLALHHYFTKSLNEWKVRRSGGRPALPRSHPDAIRPEEQFRSHDQNEVFDDDAARIFKYAEILCYRDVRRTDMSDERDLYYNQQALDVQPWLPKSEADWQEQREIKSLLGRRAGAVFADDSYVARDAKIFTHSLYLGARSWIAANAIIRGSVRIGADCSINSYAHLAGNVSLGTGCRIASLVSIYGFNHGIEQVDIPIRDQPITSVGVILHDDVWVGANASIVDGVEIGAHCVVAAGSVVTKSFPEYQIIGGNPARVIRDRRRDNRAQDEAD